MLVLGLLMVTAIGVLLNESVQKRLVLSRLGEQVDVVDMDRIRIRPGGLVLDGLYAEEQGTSLWIEHAEVKGPLLSALLFGEWDLESVSLDGVKADLTTVMAGTGAGLAWWLDLLEGEGTGDWQGVLALMQPRSNVQLGRLTLTGELRLDEERKVSLDLSGKDLATGKTAEVEVNSVYFEDAEDSPVDVVSVKSVLSFAPSEGGGIAAVEARLNLEILGEQMGPDRRVQYLGVLKISKTDGGERYEGLLDAPQTDGDPKRLLETVWVTAFEQQWVQGRLQVKGDARWLPPEVLQVTEWWEDYAGEAVLNGSFNYGNGHGEASLSGGGSLDGEPWSLVGNVKSAGTVYPSLDLKADIPVKSPEPAVVHLAIEGDAGDAAAAVMIPVSFERLGRVSDLLVTTDWGSANLNPFKVDLWSESLSWQDLEPIIRGIHGWVRSKRQVGRVVPGASVSSDPALTVPWQGFSGVVDFEVKELLMPQKHRYHGLSGRMELNEQEARLEGFKCGVDGGQVNVDFRSGIATTDDEPRVFSDVDLRIESIPLAAIYPLLDVKEPYWLSGDWSGNLAAESESASWEGMARAFTGTLKLEGRRGRVRALAANQETEETSRMLTGGAALLGQMLGAKRIQATAQMTQYMTDIPFETLTVEVQAEKPGWVNLNTLRLEGPDLLVDASLRVFGERWSDLMVSPMDLKCELGSQGRLEEAARQLGLVGAEERDGYQLWKNRVRMQGTLSDVDLQDLLKQVF